MNPRAVRLRVAHLDPAAAIDVAAGAGVVVAAALAPRAKAAHRRAARPNISVVPVPSSSAGPIKVDRSTGAHGPIAHPKIGSDRISRNQDVRSTAQIGRATGAPIAIVPVHRKIVVRRSRA
jgi:hypothetical protein